MKKSKRLNKKIAVVVALVLILLVSGIGAAAYYMTSGSSEAIYKEATVEYGPLTVGITEDGTVEIGAIDQTFDLDISEFSSSSSSSGGGGNPFMGMGGSSGNNDTRKMEIEEIYVKVGQEISKGDPLLKLTDESVAEIREELVADEEDARVAYESLVVDQEKSMQEASQEYEQNQVYGNAAQLEYDEALYDLKKAMDDALEDLEDAQEDLQDLQDDLQEVLDDYEEAKYYLEQTTAAIDSESEPYWYLKNEESREAAKQKVEDEEDDIEKYEDDIRDKEHEITTLKIAYDEAVAAYQAGEVDARTQYDKRILNLNKAAEIYSIATDNIEYQVRVAKEDYEDASEKLQEFDSYIIDGVVSADYEGAITELSVAAGDEIKSDSTIATLNNYEDITVTVNVDDDDMKSVAVGDTVNIYFSAFPDGNFTAKVSDIGDATIDSNSDVTYEVEISVSGDVAGLYAGMTSDVTFITKETKDVIYVSNRAVTRDGTRSYVKRKDEDGNIETVDVVTGFSDGSSVEIKEGLKEGDVVLIESKVTGE